MLILIASQARKEIDKMEITRIIMLLLEAY